MNNHHYQNILQFFYLGANNISYHTYSFWRTHTPFRLLNNCFWKEFDWRYWDSRSIFLTGTPFHNKDPISPIKGQFPCIDKISWWSKPLYVKFSIEDILRLLLIVFWYVQTTVCDIFTIFRWLLIPVFPLSQKTSPLPIVWLIYYKSTNKDMCQMVNFSCDLYILSSKRVLCKSKYIEDLF